jgi:hypothetical protein
MFEELDLWIGDLMGAAHRVENAVSIVCSKAKTCDGSCPEPTNAGVGCTGPSTNEIACNSF